MQVTTLLTFRFPSRRERGAQQKRLLMWRRSVLLGGSLFLALSCLFFLRSQRAIMGSPALTPVVTASSAWAQDSFGSERGAGGVGKSGTDAHLPAIPAVCNPFDTSCFANGVASWIATQIQNALQPIADQILKNPANIISQTPLLQGDSQDTPLLNINHVFIGVIDAALACFLVIGAYNAIIGHHLGMWHTTITELIPRAILVVGAVHFNQLFLTDFINLENTLSLAVVHAVGLNLLTNILAGLFTNMLADGPLVFLLMVVLGIMTLLLLIQMVTRLALVALCVATAPLGLGCLMLVQSMRWGRLWLTLFASSVMVQLLQVVALGLGGVFLTAIASTSLVRLDVQLATAFLAIGTLYLVLKIPGMLQNWALHPMMDGFNAGGGNAGHEGHATGGEGGGGIGGGDAVGGQMMEGTIVTEESGATLLLF